MLCQPVSARGNRVKCSNGHDVAGGAPFCSRRGASTTGVSERRRGLRSPRVLGAAAGVIALIGGAALWVALAGSSESTPGADDVPATTAPAELGPEEKCQLSVLEIAAAGLDDQRRNDGSNTGLNQMVYKYGASNPVFVAATQQVLPKAWLAAPLQGMDEALLVAQQESFVVCADPAVSGATPSSGGTEPPGESVDETAVESATTDPAPGDATASTALNDDDEWPPAETPPPVTGEPCANARSFEAGSFDCAQADLLSEMCPGAQPPFVVARTGGGTTEWEPITGEASVSAFTSGNTESGPQVLSCGAPTNGVNVADFLADLKQVADAGWGINIDLVACGARDSEYSTPSRWSVSRRLLRQRL